MNKSYFEARRKELDTAYNALKPDWQELADYYLPRSARFLLSDTNKKPAKNRKIKDSAPLKAVRNFSSGMMTGATNPATNWFRLRVKNFNVNNNDYDVKRWCSQVENVIRDVLNASNFYKILPNVYKQFGVFGISAVALETGTDRLLNCRLLPVGSYKIARNQYGEVDTLCRMFRASAKNVYERFGKDNVSSSVLSAIKSKNTETYVDIVHFVCPNADYVPASPFAKDKKFVSVYYEIGGDGDKFLSKSGYDNFPYVVFEAEACGDDVYPSDCPGVNALPDVKQLMAEVIDKGKTIKKIITPSFRGPATLKNKKINDTPGVFVEEDESGRGLTPVYQVPPQLLVPIREDIADLRNSISEIFFNDLFAMILNTADRMRTATEVNELKEEKMVLLSPLLEQVHAGLTSLMEWVFVTCFERGIIPEAPVHIQGEELNIEFVSMLAQAQKAVKISAMERFNTFTLNLAQATNDPVLLKKLNTGKIIDDYADYANINPEQIFPDEKIEEYRRQLAEKQAQQEQMEQLKQGSEMIKNVAGIDAHGGELMERLGVG